MAREGLSKVIWVLQHTVAAGSKNRLKKVGGLVVDGKDWVGVR